jgi:hypothetical protein
MHVHQRVAGGLLLISDLHEALAAAALAALLLPKFKVNCCNSQYLLCRTVWRTDDAQRFMARSKLFHLPEPGLSKNCLAGCSLTGT